VGTLLYPLSYGSGSAKQSPQQPSSMTGQGTARGRFGCAIQRRHLTAAEMAARAMGGLSLEDALSLCALMAELDPARYERAALRWLQRFIDERLPPLAEVTLAASALPRFDRAVATWGLRRSGSYCGEASWPGRFPGRGGSCFGRSS
jgi:hypothetical protein